MTDTDLQVTKPHDLYDAEAGGLTVPLLDPAPADQPPADAAEGASPEAATPDGTVQEPSEVDRNFAALMAAFPESHDWGENKDRWGYAGVGELNLMWCLKPDGELSLYVDEDECRLIMATVPHKAPLVVKFGNEGNEERVSLCHYALLMKAFAVIHIGAKQVPMPDGTRTLWDMLEVTEFAPFCIGDMEISPDGTHTVWELLQPKEEMPAATTEEAVG